MNLKVVIIKKEIKVKFKIHVNHFSNLLMQVIQFAHDSRCVIC